MAKCTFLRPYRHPRADAPLKTWPDSASGLILGGSSADCPLAGFQEVGLEAACADIEAKMRWLSG